MKPKKTSPKRITKWTILVTLVIMTTLALLAYPTFRKTFQSVAKLKAISNSKEIGSAMLGFVDQYGSYPSEETRQILADNGVNVLPRGNDANSYLAQLLASGSVDSELLFHIRRMDGMHKGDNDFSTADKMLAKGENGFGYVMLKNNRPLQKPESITPVVVAPLATGGSDPRFDPRPFAGQYIFMTPDGSLSCGKISNEGLPLAKGRGPGGLFQKGESSVFGDEIPDVKMPR